MVLVSRHPIVIRLAPLLRDLRLSVRVDAVVVGELGGPLGRIAGALEFYQADEAVVVFVAKVCDAAAVTTALCDKARTAACLLEEGAFAFVEADSHGVIVLVGLREAALYPALPVWVVVLDWKPEFHVVMDTHVEVGRSLVLVLGSWK